MALRKGFCTRCKGEDKKRIFSVNKDATTCFCPNCMAELKPKVAIENYKDLLSSYLKKGSESLFETTEYFLAYRTFAHIIEINRTIKTAYYGRILSLLYLSTLRKSYINSACSLHKKEAENMFHFQETVHDYFHFLNLLLNALDAYETRMKKRITSNNLFIDADCVILYLTRIEEIRNYKLFIASEAQLLIDNDKEKFKEIVDRVSHSLKRFDDILKETYPITNGNNYAFLKYCENNVPLITLSPEKHKIKSFRFRTISLYSERKGHFLINDRVYKNNLLISRLVKISIPLGTFLCVSAIVGFVFAFIAESAWLKIILNIYSFSAISFSIALLILDFLWKKQLKNKYYNGIDPFILK